MPVKEKENPKQNGVLCGLGEERKKRRVRCEEEVTTQGVTTTVELKTSWRTWWWTVHRAESGQVTEAGDDGDDDQYR